MKAIVLKGKKIHLEEVPEPNIEQANEVKIKVLKVGICGTDRELIAKGIGIPPPNEKGLILGHEMLGQVVETGKNVRSFHKHDYVVVTVRRGCNQCPSCLNQRSDLCSSGKYTERGIKARHGFQSEYVVDEEQYLVKVPKSFASIGFLCEPMSVVEKAIDELLNLQKQRLANWKSDEDLQNKSALVVGLGPIGLLACFTLRAKGMKVYGLEVSSSKSLRAQILEQIGGIYINGNEMTPEAIANQFGPMDIILEAAGVADLDFHLLESLQYNGGYVLTGIPGHEAIFSIPGGHLIASLVLKNQLLLGSVNASRKHWDFALSSLEKIEQKWPGKLVKLVTSSSHYTQFETAFIKKPEEIKSILEWNESSA